VAEVENAEDARTVVQRLAAEGVDFVKMVSDSVLVPVQIPDDVMAAIIAQGHRHGLEVVGHVAEAEFMRKAAEMGLDGFVHATFRPLPVERARELASVLVQHGTPVTTTLSAELVYSGEPVQQVFELMSGLRQSVEGAAQALATMAEEGVQLVVGTDWCSCAPLGDGPLHPAIRAGAVTITEMEMLGWGGLANEAVLAAATINAARALGLSSELGTLEVGKVADLILVEGNPLDDIAALRNVRTVVQGGAVVVEN
jgi:enamidase